jgi:hypothetical protein
VNSARMVGGLLSYVIVAGASALGLSACSKPAEQVAPGMGYAAMAQLPDFGGWWIWQYAPSDQLPNGAPPMIFMDAPFNPEVAKWHDSLIKQVAEAFGKAVSQDPAKNDDSYNKTGYCRPPVFYGVMAADFNNWFEMLYTPGRVTLLDEEGLIRRVDLNGTLPTEVETSDSGTSVGHWEGQTLVVETLRKGRMVPPEVPMEHPDGLMKVVERFTLKEPDLLQNEVTITVPNVFTRPYQHTYLYRRDRQHAYHDETPCVDYDRFGDAAKGKQRFDLTPPSDLPPPPKE